MVARQPVPDNPVTDNPVIDDPVTENPVTLGPATLDPGTDRPVRWLIGVAAGVWGRLIGSIALGALAAAFGVGLMATSAWLIARAAQHPPVLYLSVAVVAVRTFGIGRGVLRYLERLVSHDSAFRVLARLRERLMAHLVLLAPAGLPVWQRGDLLSRLVSDVDDVGDAFLRGLLPLAVAAAVGAATVTLATLILPAAGIALAAALVAACLLGPLFTSCLRRRVETQVVELRGARSRVISEMLDDMTDLSLGDLLPGRLAELDEVERRASRAAAGSARTGGLAAGTAVLAMGAAVVLALMFGVPAVAAGRLQPVLLAVVALTPLALADIVQSVGVAAATLRRSIAAAGRLAAVLATPPLVPSRPAAEYVVPLRLPGGPVVVLHGVSARWPGAETDAISDIDLELVPGRRIVVLGESGSGKSTLLSVLLGFLPPTAGRITVDGVDVADLDPDQVRTLYSWCDQQAHLFDSSLAENIRLARPDADDADIMAALAAAGAEQWVAALPGGLRTRVGEHGQAISGGQRQRIALARALLAERPILLADEPAAHLDAPAARAVTEIILRPDPFRCTVLVTHRESDAAGADVLVRLARGRMVGGPEVAERLGSS